MAQEKLTGCLPIIMDETEYEYAGFWVRLGATLIDTIILMAITYPLLVSIYGWQYFNSEKFISGPADFIISWLLPIVGVIWFWTKKEATPGKMALSLRLVDADSGKALSVGQSIGRYLAYFVSVLPLCLGFMWVGFDAKKQGWHDKLAGTVVIRSKNRGPKAVRFPNA